MDPKKVRPLFCGGITVFNPIVQLGVKATDRVGVVGIGGLGHLALEFLHKWGCEVTAFTSSESKAAEAAKLGAHHIVPSRSDAVLEEVAGTCDLMLFTVNVPLNWEKYLAALAPRGRLHIAGAILGPIPAGAFSMLVGQKSLSGSPLGSPGTTAHTLDFYAHHSVEAVTEHFPMSRVNDALEHLRMGKARYRIVLDRN